MLLSRAYSYRGIRLKQYAVSSFIMVALAQGGLSFYNMYIGIQGLDYFPKVTAELGLKILIASLFVGAIYPITQIYQHDDDRKNGDRTISLLLGIKGTLLFSGLLFLISNVLLFHVFTFKAFVFFEICMLAPIYYFFYWCKRVWLDEDNANFKNTMKMALSASIAMIVGFSIVLLANL